MKSSPKVPTNAAFDPQIFLALVDDGQSVKTYMDRQSVFAQGDPADAIFYIHKGKIKLTVVSSRGKEAVVAILGTGEFFGEGCLAGQVIRMSTATAMTAASVTRIEKSAAIRVLREEPAF